MNKEMQRALEADGEKLRQLTGEDHGPFQHYIVTVYKDAGVPYRALLLASSPEAAREAAKDAWDAWDLDTNDVTFVRDDHFEYDNYDFQATDDIEPATEDDVKHHLAMVENEKNPPAIVGLPAGEIEIILDALNHWAASTTRWDEVKPIIERLKKASA